MKKQDRAYYRVESQWVEAMPLSVFQDMPWLQDSTDANGWIKRNGIELSKLFPQHIDINANLIFVAHKPTWASSKLKGGEAGKYVGGGEMLLDFSGGPSPLFILLHEIAHHVTYPSEEMHGHGFVKAMSLLISKFLGKTAARLYENIVYRGVK